MIYIPLDLFEKIGDDDKAILAFIKIVRYAEPTDGVITGSIRQLSKSLNISYSDFRYAVSRLHQKGIIAQTSAQGFAQDSTQLTICDFASYDIGSRKVSRSTSRKASRKQETAETNNKENIQEVVIVPLEQKYKNFDLSYIDSQLYGKFCEFLKMRDAIRKPLKTDNGIRKSYGELLKRATEDSSVHKCSVIEAAINIIQRSIDKEWQGFFNVPLNYNGNRQSNNSMAATQQRIDEFLAYRADYNKRQGSNQEDEPLF